VRVGVIDIGANTLRLLVAEPGPRGGVANVHMTRAELALGEDIEQFGSIRAEKLARVREAAQEKVGVARKLGCEAVEIVVTSPGRQATNADELIEALECVKGAPVRVLTAEEEGTYAFKGATAGIRNLPESVAVCDVGGGSTQIAVGLREEGPAWIRSLDVGSRRLAARAFRHDPPSTQEIEHARAIVDELVAELAPPLPQVALATGGSARALRKLVGQHLGPAELAAALRIAATTPARRLVKDYDVSSRRSETVAAGVLLLSAAQLLLGVPLTVARGGLREGVAARLFEKAALAA
jgi:exopolyphosphatase / guanosine-5'-triphosphate,3'-diphosphate pyrophosphatase